MTWAFKRQAFYLLIVVAFLVVCGFIILYPIFNKPPSCTDGAQNGNETGIDCGGSCALACVNQVSNISILWTRVFEVVPGRYNAAAYIQNQNDNAAINKIHYKFRFADKDNLYIGSREGSTFVPAGGKFVVFEPAIDVGHSIPVYASLSFTESPQWIQVPENRIRELQISVGDVTSTNEDSTPIVNTTLKNNSLFTIPEVKVIVILYDASGNAVNLSSTYIPSLGGGQTTPITFTWLEPFVGKVVTKEVIPMFNIFSVKFQ